MIDKMTNKMIEADIVIVFDKAHAVRVISNG